MYVMPHYIIIDADAWLPLLAYAIYAVIDITIQYARDAIFIITPLLLPPCRAHDSLRYYMLAPCHALRAATAIFHYVTTFSANITPLYYLIFSLLPFSLSNIFRLFFANIAAALLRCYHELCSSHTLSPSDARCRRHLRFIIVDAITLP